MFDFIRNENNTIYRLNWNKKSFAVHYLYRENLYFMLVTTFVIQCYNIKDKISNLLAADDMDERLNLGSDVRELKLGSTFSANNATRTSSSFHTLKCK